MHVWERRLVGSVSLPLLEDVRIMVYPGSNSFTERSTILLTCVGYGSPTNPNITWSREGELVGESDNVTIYQEVIERAGVMFVMSTLKICSIGAEHAGLSTCVATAMNSTAVSPNFWINVTSCEYLGMRKVEG